MKATNAPEADQFLRREYRKGWEDCCAPNGAQQLPICNLRLRIALSH